MILYRFQSDFAAKWRVVVSVSIRNIRCELWFLSECIGARANKYPLHVMESIGNSNLLAAFCIGKYEVILYQFQSDFAANWRMVVSISIRNIRCE